MFISAFSIEELSPEESEAALRVSQYCSYAGKVHAERRKKQDDDLISVLLSLSNHRLGGEEDARLCCLLAKKGKSAHQADCAM